MPKNADPQAAQIEVELQKHHTHNGEDLAPGDKIKVDTATAAWLADNGVIKPAEIPSPPEQTSHSSNS